MAEPHIVKTWFIEDLKKDWKEKWEKIYHVKVIATRDLKAGELVELGDVDFV